MNHRLRPLSLAAALLAGCAHAAAPPAAQAPAASPAPLPAAPAPEAVPATAAMVVTGSRIPQRVDLSTGLPRTTSAVTVWTRPALDGTGEPGVGDAVKKLSP